MTNPFAKLHEDNTEARVRNMLKRERKSSNNPFALDMVDVAATQIASKIQQEEKAILRELRGDRVTFNDTLREAMREIKREEIEKRKAAEAAAKMERELSELEKMKALNSNVKSERNRLNNYLRGYNFTWRKVSAEDVEDMWGGEEYLLYYKTGKWELIGKIKKGGRIVEQVVTPEEALAKIETHIRKKYAH